MAQIYLKLMAIDSKDYIVQLWEVPDATYLTGLEFGTAERDPMGMQYRPLLRTSFTMHGDIKTLHTICRRRKDNDTIDPVEW